MRPSTKFLLPLIYVVLAACEMHSADEPSLHSTYTTPAPVHSPTMTPPVDHRAHGEENKAKVAKSPINDKLIEVIGLVLVLGSSFWRLFLAERIKEIADGVDRYRLEEKVDAVFWVALVHYLTKRPDATTKGIALNLDSYIDRFPPIPSETSVRGQYGQFSKIANWGFIIGSILIILPKVISLLYGTHGVQESINPLDLTP